MTFSVVIQKGIGYVPSEKLMDYTEKDYITLDAFFTPVKRAVYDIENVLVEDNPDFEKIIFTITTDGQLSPISAFKNALEAMYQQLSIFTKIVDVDLVSGVVANKQTETHAKLFEKVENLSLSVRSFNCLDKANIRFIGELAVMDEAELKGLKNLGKKSLEEIKSVMEEIGYPVGKDIGDKEVLKKKMAELKNEKIEG